MKYLLSSCLLDYLIFIQDCKSVPRQECHTTYKKDCHTEYRSVTNYVPEQKCTTVQDPVERKVPRENCVSVPRQECKQVPREKVEYRSEQVCKTVNDRQCKQVSRQDCGYHHWVWEISGKISVSVMHTCDFTFYLDFNKTFMPFYY